METADARARLRHLNAIRDRPLTQAELDEAAELLTGLGDELQEDSGGAANPPWRLPWARMVCVFVAAYIAAKALIPFIWPRQ